MLKKLEKFAGQNNAKQVKGGSITGREHIIGREFAVQSFRDKDNSMLGAFYPIQKDYSAIDNPFELEDYQRLY